jgi:hypothetical protein
MTPADEARYAEIIQRLQAEQAILSARMDAMEELIEGMVCALGVKKQGQPSTSELVKMRAVQIVNEKLKHYADDEMADASELKKILDEYQRS